MLTDTSASPYAQMTSMAPGSCRITGTSPLAVLRDRALRVTIPTMGRIMFDPSVAHAYQNFLVAAGDVPGKHDGPPFMDGDLYKWLEAATVMATETGDEELSGFLAEAADAISRAQRPDGYVHTRTIIAQRQGSEARPLERRLDFETYNFGHLMTLACVHHRATGEDAYLQLAIRVAGYLTDVAKEHPELLSDCNICPSHYMGVVELYRTTRDPAFLELAGRLLDLHGGKGYEGSDDNQDVRPVRDQRQAVGHSVRANYLYAGMADYALETGEGELVAALTSIWEDLVTRKLYVTGGCGALYDGASPDAAQDHRAPTRVHQAYGRAYQLPNTTAYNESCASLGLVMWAWRMLALTGESRYADEIERVLYNALPAMIGADGKTYFYTNPLRQVRDLPIPLRRAGNPLDSVPPPSQERVRQEYMTACFCCPPNVARFIAEIPYYTYSRNETDLWVHQFVSGRTSTTVGGVPVVVEQETEFPVAGRSVIRVSAEVPARGVVRVRIPGWADQTVVTVDGVTVERIEMGYAVIDWEWRQNTIRVEIPMRARLTVAHHFLEEATNQVCVVRGPVVYCVESADLPADVGVESLAIPASITWTEERGTDIFTGHVLLRGAAARLPDQVPADRLYGELNQADPTALDIRLVPYARWGNRGPGEMSVWLQLLR
ncbi:glycoside hydrolase family 127 protein [Actinopolymorpha pittospori]|uniref:DUF1680 family protein n=1 Tax=Actinopolymorpha pittospori TaxID=648752 RepID=A0A927MXP0_9ACTN|nr:beta-L-arabinofuranosidase domain-containing protein [Actinopolymorpha pittospori]MBE1608396.1 DUF1680 family protein [Actinopolymorpha pittospori]